MRCKACNEELTDKEATKRCRHSGDFMDLCIDCYEAGYEGDEELFEDYDGDLFRVLEERDYG